PNYCRAFSVCLMPFAMNSATQYINPTKALEYMATGRAVVSTPVKDVVRQYSNLVYIAGSAEEFIAACDKAIREPDEARVARGIEKARANSWENIVQEMQGLITKAIGEDAGGRRKKVEPLSEASLTYLYHPTPGS